MNTVNDVVEILKASVRHRLACLDVSEDGSEIRLHESIRDKYEGYKFIWCPAPSLFTLLVKKPIILFSNLSEKSRTSINDPVMITVNSNLLGVHYTPRIAIKGMPLSVGEYQIRVFCKTYQWANSVLLYRCLKDGSDV